MFLKGYWNNKTIILSVTFSSASFILGYATRQMIDRRYIAELKEKAEYYAKIDHAIQTLAQITDYIADEDEDYLSAGTVKIPPALK